MPHGLPDWGQVEDISGYVLTEDLAELAARLGSICTFDRRGSVVFLDDFSHGAGHWDLEGTGSGEALNVSSAYCLSPPYSGKIITRAQTNAYAKLIKWTPYPPDVKIGWEISFSFDENINNLRWGFYGEGQEYCIFADVRYNISSETLSLNLLDEGVTELATGVYLQQELYCFHTAKLVIDVKNRKYVRFILDNTEYDLTTYSYATETGGYYGYNKAFYFTQTKDNVAAVSYVDNAILTKNEG